MAAPLAASTVMAGLVPAIHVFLLFRDQDVDAQDKPGHEGEIVSHLRRHEVLHPNPIPLLDHLRDPLPVTMGVIALVAEDADRA
jgi:hypothetical protein